MHLSLAFRYLTLFSSGALHAQFPEHMLTIFDIITGACTPRERYTAMLHEYGLKQGVEVYRLIKDVTI